MRIMIAMVVLGVTTQVAIADPARELAQRGEAYAREGRFSDAIDLFKRADRMSPRTSHACLIALAYLRRELYTQAELFFARCRERASTTDPAPDWLQLAEAQLRQLASRTDLAPIDVRVEPANVGAALELSSLSLDEHFTPRRVRLPRGLHVLTATAPDRRAVRTIVEVTDDSHKQVVLRFAEAKPGVPPILQLAEPPRSRVPAVLAAVGGTTLAAGLGYHVFAREPIEPREREQKRTLTYAMLGVGGATVLTGLVLRYTVYRSAPPTMPVLTAQVSGSATTVGVEWRR